MIYIEIDEKSIIKALKIVSVMEGLSCSKYGVIMNAGSMDAYLLISVMADLFESGNLHITFNPDGKGDQDTINFFIKLCDGVNEIV